MQETKRRGLSPWVWKIPWRSAWKARQSTPVFLPGESHGQRSLVGYSPRGCKESDKTERLHFHFHLSVQFSHSVVSDSLQPHESQHARPLCPSPTPGAHSDSHPSSQGCHPAISSPSPPDPIPPSTRVFSSESTLHEVAKVLEFQL